MSSKATAPQGRRTPLSLSGGVTKSQTNKGSTNIVNGGGANANGHPASSNNKQDNKLQQQKGDQPAVSNVEAKENPSKKQQPQAEKKSLQNDGKKANEKSQNGSSSSNKQQQEANDNKQQQQIKEKTVHQNGSEENKVNEKEKTEKSDKTEKPKEKSEKDITKSKEDKKKEQSVPQNKKDEKKAKEVPKDTKEDKKEVSCKSDAIAEVQPDIKSNDNKSKDEQKEKVKTVEKKAERKEEIMDVVDDQVIQKTNPATPKSNSKVNRTPVNKTPTKIGEKTPQKPPVILPVQTALVFKREETTTIDDNDIEMEPLAIDNSPVKSAQSEAAIIKLAPAATSTPGKILLSKRNTGVSKSDVQLALQTENSPERPRMFSQISGRKSIRPISEYTPSKFQSNLQFRESYRRINTELDVTNTSMNVTVGSEVPSNFSFSLFGRGRKRERTPPLQLSQSAIGELQTDVEASPPKRARFDFNGLISAVSSPMTLLRSRFSKASLQSSTPVKLQQKLTTAEDEIEVQNVSGVSENEEITTPDKEPAETSLAIDDNNATLGEEVKETKLQEDSTLYSDATELREVSYEKIYGTEESCDQSDIKITEAPLQPVGGDPMAKNKRCVVM